MIRSYSQVLAYLASYTHRVAISNQRILAFDGERVTFQYRDYHDGNARKSMDLPRRQVCLLDTIIASGDAVIESYELGSDLTLRS